jgi:hypothetical protein
MRITKPQVEYHRNGVAGNGFHAVLFGSDKARMLAVVFEERGNVAVFDLAKLSAGDIGPENKWRGDAYEDDLRQIIKDHDAY